MEFDKDLTARQEARALLRQAEQAQKKLADFSQSQLDAIVKAICDAIDSAAPELAELAVRETGFGNVEDKIAKNRFASRRVWDAVKDMKTVGVRAATPLYFRPIPRPFPAPAGRPSWHRRRRKEPVRPRAVSAA